MHSRPLITMVSKLNDSGTLHTIVLVQGVCTISIANKNNIINITQMWSKQ